MSEELDEAFLDYVSYLVFMAAQLPWGSTGASHSSRRSGRCWR